MIANINLLLYSIIFIISLATFCTIPYTLRMTIGLNGILFINPTYAALPDAVTPGLDKSQLQQQQQQQQQQQRQQQLLQDQQGEENFSAELKGITEVPPVNTEATGIVNLALNNEEGAKILSYGLTITNLHGIVIGAHIHLGSLGQNGPVIADMRPPNINASPSSSSASSTTAAGSAGAISSKTVSGTITPADLKGPLAGKQLSNLLDLLSKGKTYVNVATEQHQNGELRGQISRGE
jgi:CHRD domain